MSEFHGTYTEHYNLAKPSGEDKVDVSVLNDNMDKIDAALYDLNQRIGPTPPQPVIDLPVECPVSEMVQNPWDPVAISYVNNTQQLNLSTEKSYICTIVGKDGINYVCDTPRVPEEKSEEGFSYLTLGGFYGITTPSLVPPITALDSIWVTNGVSFDAEGNPVMSGFYIDVSAGDSQGNPHTDDIRESVDKIIISEYTE